jgi:hypothetical protein
MDSMIYINEVSLITSVNHDEIITQSIKQPVQDNWFDATKYLGRKGHRYYSQPVKLTLAAASRLNIGTTYGQRAGVFMATDTADREVRSAMYRNLSGLSDENISPAFAPNSSVNMAAGCLTEKYSIHGPSFTFTGRDGTACIALWRALMELKRNDIDMALVGQVEYLKNELVKSGALLWKLSNRKTSETLLTIEYKGWTRWLPVFKNEINLKFNDTQHNIYLIGNMDLITEKIISVLDKMNKPFEYFNDTLIKQRLLPQMYPFCLLSLAALKRASATVFLVFDKGHIFHYQLINQEQSNE